MGRKDMRVEFQEDSSGGNGIKRPKEWVTTARLAGIMLRESVKE